MSYQYSRMSSDQHRDVAHWRGARGGVRVLNVPTCAGWLQRQANDACYDFWADLSIGAHLVRDPAAREALIDDGARPSNGQARAIATSVFVMQKDPDGSWSIDPWRTEQAGAVRPLAANGEAGHDGASVGRSTRDFSRSKSKIDSTGSPRHGAQHGCGDTSFIIEIGARRA
ncbi:MAG: hypothetical protein JWP59_1720 [Massilia sp.]|nr:hypothetical protein [Massilia sp.]